MLFLIIEEIHWNDRTDDSLDLAIMSTKKTLLKVYVLSFQNISDVSVFDRLCYCCCMFFPLLLFLLLLLL